MIPPSPEPSDPGSLAAVAREVDVLRREVAPLRQLPARLDRLSAIVVELAETVSAVAARKATTPVPSWLMAPTDPNETRERLDELAAWLPTVYLRYPDALASFPECWCWHPDVVEELLWLMYAWSAAYQGSSASVAFAGDWHDRQRPGVVRRIKASAGTCSLENHQTRPGWPAPTTTAPRTPAESELGRIAEWWASAREQPAPEPPPRNGSPIASALRGEG